MLRRLSFLAVLVAATATPAAAQQDSLASVSREIVPRVDTLGEAPVAPAPSAAPMVAASVAAVPVAVTRRHQAPPLPTRALQSRAGLGQARAMMIVGGGALLAGAIIDGDAGTIIMVGGAIIGLYGLYKYLQ